MYQNFLFFPTVDPPHITRDPVPQTVTTGADIEMSITATGDELQFQWQKDGQCVDENKPQFSFRQTNNSSTLQIQSVEKSDKGRYKCLVWNPVENSETSSSEAELKVCKFLVCGY